MLDKVMPSSVRFYRRFYPRCCYRLSHWLSSCSAVSVFSLMLLTATTQVAAADERNATELLGDIGKSLLKDLPKTALLLDELDLKKTQLSKVQLNRFYLLKASYLGFTGKHSERVALVKGVIDEVNDANTQVKFFYEMTDGYIYLGEYEEALVVMNQGIRLLPKLTDINAKVSMLQGATTLLISLRAFTEAQNYANRIYQIGVESDSPDYICYGWSNQIDILFKLGEIEAARIGVNDAIKVCDRSNFNFVSGILRSWDAINLIDTGEDTIGVAKALIVLADLHSSKQNSSYVQLLEEAIARGYYHLGELDKAHTYGLLAYDRAIESEFKERIKNASKTMAQIKRAQGDFTAALDYYDVYQQQRDQVEQDKNAKNLAYQRVKYDNLDKTNQLELLKFKNNSLSLAQKLQERNNQNLILVVLLAVVLLIFMSILLVVSLKQKRALVYAQPSPEQSNDLAGFIQRCEPAVNDLRQSGGCFSVILFELDDYAKLEDHPEDAMGFSLINEVTQVCRQQVRHSDQFSRISDNKFVVCLLQSTEQGAVILSERCQTAIAAIEVQSSEISLPLTSTFGIAMIGDGFVEINEALGAADKALQLAKAAGSNQLYVYHPDESHAPS